MSHHEFIRHPFPKQPSRSVDINLACLQLQYFHGQARSLQTHGDIVHQLSFWLLFGLTRILIPFEAALVAMPGTTGHCGILQSITPEEVLKGWETLRAASAGNNTVGLGWDPTQDEGSPCSTLGQTLCKPFNMHHFCTGWDFTASHFRWFQGSGIAGP